MSMWDPCRCLDALEATQAGSQHLKSIFESHLGAAGRMLVLLDDIRPGGRRDTATETFTLAALAMTS